MENTNEVKDKQFIDIVKEKCNTWSKESLEQIFYFGSI